MPLGPRDYAGLIFHAIAVTRSFRHKLPRLQLRVISQADAAS